MSSLRETTLAPQTALACTGVHSHPSAKLRATVFWKIMATQQGALASGWESY